MIFGWFTEEEAAFIINNFNAIPDVKGCIVEVGAYFGRSTVFFADNIPDTKIYSIDPWDNTIYARLNDRAYGGKHPIPADAYEQFLKNTAGFPNVIPLKGTSEFYAFTWTGGPIKLLFIDGCHTYEYVYKDWACWKGFIAQGGLLCFHDCIGNWPDIVRTANECERSGEFAVLGRGGSVKGFIKR